MVKPAFKDIDVDLWVHSGNLGVTRTAVCLFHDDCAKGAQLLDALGELESETKAVAASTQAVQRTITCRNRKHRSALRTLRIKLEAIRDELKVMHIGHDRETVTIVMTAAGLSILKAAVAKWLNGAEDFGVSPSHGALSEKKLGVLDRESGELWFWGPYYVAP